MTLQDWTATECALRDALVAGKPLDLRGTGPEDLTRASSWPEERVVRAGVLAELLQHPPNGHPAAPTRLILSGARVTGHLDVGCADLAPFLFQGCSFEMVPNFNDARASFAGWVSCLLPGLSADRLSCVGPVWLTSSVFAGKASFEDSTIYDFAAAGAEFRHDNGHSLCVCGSRVSHDVNMTGTRSAGSIGVVGAQIDGQLILKDSILQPASGPAIAGAEVVVGGALNASEITAAAPIHLPGARVGGQLILSKSKITAPGQTACNLDHAEVRLGVFCDEIEILGAMRMHHAKVGCQVTFARSRLRHAAGVAFKGDHLVVDGSLMMHGGSTVEGQIDLHGARIECTLNFYGLVNNIAGEKRFGLELDAAVVGGGLLLAEGRLGSGIQSQDLSVGGVTDLSGTEVKCGPSSVSMQMTRAKFGGGLKSGSGFKCEGTWVLQDAVVSGVLDLSDAVLSGAGGRSLSAAGLRVQTGLIADRLRTSATVDLASVQAGGDVRFADAVLEGSRAEGASRGSVRDRRTGGLWRGTSLHMPGAVVEGDLDLRGLTATETIELRGSRVGRTLDLQGAHLGSAVGLALSAKSVSADIINLTLAAGTKSRSDLSGAKVETLIDAEESWMDVPPPILDGFEYKSLHTDMPDSSRLAWLAGAVGGFSPQPYQQLATVYVGAGEDSKARATRYAAHRRQSQTAEPLRRFWGALQDILVGYGYKPGRAVFWACLLWLGGFMWFSLAPNECIVGGVEQVGLCPANPNSHPTWNPAVLSLDFLIPVARLGQAGAWRLTSYDQLISLILLLAGALLLSCIATAVGRSLRRP